MPESGVIFLFKSTRQWMVSKEETPIFNRMFSKFYAEQLLGDSLRAGRTFTPPELQLALAHIDKGDFERTAASFGG